MLKAQFLKERNSVTGSELCLSSIPFHRLKWHYPNLLSVVNIMTKSSLGREDLAHRQETPKQGLQIGTWGRNCRGMLLLACTTAHIQHISHRARQAHMCRDGWSMGVPTCVSHQNKLPHRQAPRPIWWRQVFSWGSLFSSIYSWQLRLSIIGQESGSSVSQYISPVAGYDKLVSRHHTTLSY